MTRKTRSLIRLLARVPLLYQLAAFITGKRVRIAGRCMLPVLAPGERVLFDRLAYKADEPQVGDIVLARHSARPGVRLIKRVAERADLAAGEFWLLGDNEAESTDGRTLGAFPQEDVIGRAWLVYWPAERFRMVKRLFSRRA